MASGVWEKVKGSGIWWTRYRDQNGKLHREKVGRKSDAIALYRKRKTELRSGTKLPLNMRAKGITFAAIADAAMQWSRQHKRDWRNDELRMPALIAAFGHREADAIKPSELDSYITAHAKAPATQNRLRALFSLIYREAQRNGHVTSNPARLVRMRPVNNSRIRYIDANEESTLTGIIERDFPHHLPAFRVAINTGMRLSEQFTMEWSQVDLLRKMIHLSHTKNGSERHIPLNTVAVEALERLGRIAPASNPSVFLTMRGERLKTPRTWFGDVVAASGLSDISWHILRHTFVSRLVMAGVDLRTVMELAGHKSMAMTLRYSHLAPEHTASAVERIVVSPEVSPAKKATRSRVAY